MRKSTVCMFLLLSSVVVLGACQSTPAQQGSAEVTTTADLEADAIPTAQQKSFQEVTASHRQIKEQGLGELVRDGSVPATPPDNRVIQSQRARYEARFLQ